VVGRPTKRTPEREQRLFEALRAGNTRKAACLYAGVGLSQFAEWQERFRDFREAIQKAEADAEVRAVAQIAQAARDGTWQAAAWWLERRRPEDYALHADTTTLAAAAMQVTIAFDHANQDQTTLSLPNAD